MPIPVDSNRAEPGRVFIGLWPPPAVADRIADVAAGCMQTGARAVHAGDLHLTLAFLGLLTARQRQAATAVLDTLCQPAFGLSLDRCGCFRRAQVAWVAASRPPARLSALHAALWVQLGAVGFTPDERPFKPHVTIARRCRSAPAGTIEPQIVWHADTLVLATSGPEAVLPRYQRLATKALA